MDENKTPICCDHAEPSPGCTQPPTHYVVTRPDGTTVTVTPEQVAPLWDILFPQAKSAFEAWVPTEDPLGLASEAERRLAHAAWRAATERAAGIAERVAVECGKRIEGADSPHAHAAQAAARIAAAIRAVGNS